MKIQKKQVRHVRLSLVVFILSIFIYLCASLFISVINTSLSYEIQENQSRIEELKEENAKLKIEISELEGKSHVYEVAESAGLSVIQDNIISIRN